MTSSTTIFISICLFLHSCFTETSHQYLSYFLCIFMLLLSQSVFLFFLLLLISFLQSPSAALRVPVSAAPPRGPESLLIIPQHGSHLHKHAAKNKPFFPRQPPYTLEAKIFPLIYKYVPLSLISFYLRK